MKVYYSTDGIPAFKRAVLTIGTFDGVHLGHRQILEQLKQEADRIDGETVIITFHPHPRKVVSADQPAFHLLNTIEERIELFDRNGIDHLVIANEIIGDRKLDRLAALAARADVISSVDTPDGVAMTGAAARRNGTELGVVIEVDIGIGRCGTQPGEETLALARQISETPGLRFEGILAWEGHVLTIDDPAAKEAAVRAVADGLAVLL